MPLYYYLSSFNFSLGPSTFLPCPTLVLGCLGFSQYISVSFAIPRIISPTCGAGLQQGLPIVMETGKVNLACMELLDQANTETFGAPHPVQVPLTVEKGPFIVISGHDLLDLKLLLMTVKIFFQKEVSEGVDDNQKNALRDSVEDFTEEAEKKTRQ